MQLVLLTSHDSWMCPPFVCANVSTDVDRRFGSLGKGSESESKSTRPRVSAQSRWSVSVSYRYRTCAFVCVVVSIDVDARFGSVSRAREANWANRADSNRMNATLSVSSHIIIRTALVCVYMSCRSVEQSGVVEAVRSVLS